MKVLALSLLCAFAGAVAGGAVAWPGARAVALASPLGIPSPVALSSPLIRTFIPGETKTTAYSTSQYINAVPAPYSFGAHQQFAVPLPQAAGFASFQPGYYPVAGSPYISAANVYYPSQAFGPFISGFGPAPILPGAPTASDMPSGPSESSGPGSPVGPTPQPAGDADSAVIESADIGPERPRKEDPPAPQSPAPAAPQPEAPSTPSQQASPPLPPANTFPNFPAIPQLPQGGPAFPSIPQLPQGSPSFPSLPQFPQNLPQAPQIPGFPQFPQVPSNLFPQGPSQAPPSNFPSAISSDQGLNDEDTVSVESA